MTQPVPEVPYGGNDPPSSAGTSAPGWLRRLFDDPAPPDAVPTGAVLLAEPPRTVPLAYRLAATSLGVWELFTIGMVALAPMALWVAVPLLRTLVLVLGTGAVLAILLRRHAHRVGILRWGKVATVTTTSTRGYGASFTNWPMRQARGWDVTTVLFTGSGRRTDISYLLDNRPGTVTVRGVPYVDGVVLADSRRPERAMVVSQFPHSVKPGIDGRFVGGLAPAQWVLSLLTLAVSAGLLVLTVWSLVDLLGR